MHAPQPHFLLFSSADVPTGRTSRWQFVLESIDGTSRLAAADEEPDAPSERAELLAVVRGLEALDQPSRVTLVTRSRYVARGIVRCLDDWRAARWRWERFGRLEPIRDHDLWQRVDRALAYHRVDCHTWPAPVLGETSDDPAAAPTPPANATPLAEAAPIPGEEPAVLIVPKRSSPGRQTGALVRFRSACDAFLSRCVDCMSTGLRSLVPLPKST